MPLNNSLIAWLNAAELMASVGLEPDPWQRAYLTSTAQRIIVCCSRQAGKSESTAHMALHKALVHPGSLTLILSPGQRQSGLLFESVMRAYRRLGAPIEATKATALQLHLANGSRIVALPGKEETVRGYSGVDLLIVDEAARVGDVLYNSVRPMLAVSGGRLVALSTPWGRSGWYYEAWHDDDGPWERYQVTAHECPRIAEAFLEEELRSLGSWWFSQEYLCEFRDAVDQLFDSSAIERAFSADVQPLFGDRLAGKAHVRKEVTPLWP